ncbi:hypothetical protein ACWCQW_37275 [Streptomyces mirabilis]
MSPSSAPFKALHTGIAAVLRRAVPAAACLLALTACGSGGGTHSDPGVASLPSPSGKTGSASGTTGSQDSGAAQDAAASGRPQERLDDTDLRRAQLVHAWDQCLVAHGAHWETKRAAIAGIKPGTLYDGVADPIPEAAGKACMNKLPLSPPEEDPDLNPHYVEDMKADIACLRAHGYKVHLTKDTSDNPKGLSWTYDGDSGAEVTESAEHTCLLQAFAGKKGK